MKTRLTLTAVAVAICLCLTALGASRAAAKSTIAQFISPSGNIACVISNFGDGSDSARCDIKNHSWKLARPHGCQLDYGDSLDVGDSGKAGATCHGDTTFGTKTKLAYGRSVTLGRFKCSSATAGVTCVNTRTRHGFFISIQSYRLY